MDVIYGLIPAILAIGFVMVGVLIWAIRSGQYDDPDGAGERILLEDEEDSDREKGRRAKERLGKETGLNPGGSRNGDKPPGE